MIVVTKANIPIHGNLHPSKIFKTEFNLDEINGIFIN